MEDSATVEAFLGGAVERLRGLGNLRQVILFGSLVWGRTTPDSDLDLLVVLDTAELTLADHRRVEDALDYARWGIPVDVLCISFIDLEQRLRLGNDLLSEIVEHGRILYGT